MIALGVAVLIGLGVALGWTLHEWWDERGES